MPTVYVTQQNPTFNYAPATKFGRLEFLWPPGYQLQADGAQAVASLEATLADATAADYLLLTGDPSIMGLAAVVMARRTGHLNILKWDNALRDYYVVEADLSGERVAA
jgi:hypothetical protein